MFSASIVTLDERAAFIDLLAGRNGSASLKGGSGARGTGRELVLVRGGRVMRRTPLIPVAEINATLGVNLGALAAAFADRLRLDGDIPITIAQAERYETALALQTPRSLLPHPRGVRHRREPAAGVSPRVRRDVRRAGRRRPLSRARKRADGSATIVARDRL